MIEQVKQIVREAGRLVLNYYLSDQQDVVFKQDNSPLTLADRASHNFLCNALNEIKPIPLISEECPITYEERKQWSEYWLIDPLDGTKEFLNGYDDFCINIALIKNRLPVLGVIYAPALNELYFGEKYRGFSYEGALKDFFGHHQEPIVGVSRSHHSENTEHFMKVNNLENYITIGSSLKFGRLARGEINLYPRFEGSKEWDIAAGHLIIQEARCQIVDLSTGKEPFYNKPSFENNSFIAYAPYIEFDKLKLPRVN